MPVNTDMTASMTNSMETQTEAQLWRPAVDPNTGKTYWYHQITRQTQWTNPLENSMMGVVS